MNLCNCPNVLIVLNIHISHYVYLIKSIVFTQGKNTNSNRLVSHKIRHKAHKEVTSFILNGRVTVQGEGHKDYHTECSFSPAIELLALHESIISPP